MLVLFNPLVLLNSNKIVYTKIILSSKESSPMSNPVFDSVNPDCIILIGLDQVRLYYPL
jgi:hypothetical protein